MNIVRSYISLTITCSFVLLSYLHSFCYLVVQCPEGSAAPLSLADICTHIRGGDWMKPAAEAKDCYLLLLKTELLTDCH